MCPEARGQDNIQILGSYNKNHDGDVNGNGVVLQEPDLPGRKKSSVSSAMRWWVEIQCEVSALQLCSKGREEENC